ncbi:MAG: glycerol-3-phosphate dehydrogenase/oxidase [Nevskia sp.]|nr:glycerol-3-phosphate dehydrogenase/oxidase [Nevskia sp.]
MTPRVSLADLPPHFDLILIGGGITGAGVVAEAARSGLKALLVEQGDFASGTSSASSKLVHGGLRYLAGGHWRLTLESVRERNRLLRERSGLIETQPFLMPVYRDMRPGLRTLRAGLAVYDLMGGQWRSRSLTAAQALALEPDIRSEGLLGAVTYDDARTDDARLTLKLIFEASAAGAVTLNYVRASGLVHRAGRVAGVVLQDAVSGAEASIATSLVINAVGAAAGTLANAPDGAPTLRPLRGSHLIFPLQRLPVRQAVSWLHPRDRRPVFVYPWLGVALCGTTDVDQVEHGAPHISSDEAAYLIEGLAHQFPQLALTLKDASACYAGVRPIVAGGKADPSSESRESAMWTAPGYIGITGGKLTTFRLTARQVLQAAAVQVPSLKLQISAQPATSNDALAARYGDAFPAWSRTQASAADRAAIDGTPYCWAELRWAARHEQVVHLDDLLLRRTRLGLLLPQGGVDILDGVAVICRDELGWDDTRWLAERARYLRDWQTLHAVPP